MHPNFLDKLYLKIYPKYLYEGQNCQSLAKIYIGIINKVPDIKPYWKIMDYLYLEPKSTFKYLGLARDLKFTGDIHPFDSILETIDPKVKEDPLNPKHAGIGDLVVVTPTDRQFLAALPILTPAVTTSTIVTNP